MTRRTSRQAAGFTLIELTVAIALLVLVVGNVWSILAQTSTALGQKNVDFDTQSQARRTLDRITMAVVGASEESLYLTSGAPVGMAELNYRSNLGVENHVKVESDPQCISMTQQSGGEVTWFENRGAAGEKRIVWSKFVAELLDGEVVNGLDDNGNGLVDESGLSFVKNGKSVTVYLTIRRPGADGKFVSTRLQETVTCRN